MAPIFGQPNYGFLQSDEDEEFSSVESEHYGNDETDMTLAQMAFYYTVFLVSIVLLWAGVFILLRLIALRQKTRDPQTRGMYAGRTRPSSLGQPPPTIYVSPANLPPPPKYDEMMAPPSYDEVVGIHYPSYQRGITPTIAVQPIAQPITDAVAAQSSNQNTPPPTYHSQAGSSRNDTTVMTVTTEDRRTVTVASS